MRSPRLKGLGQSATVAINDQSNRLVAQGKDVIKLGLGQSPFPVPDSLVEALRAHAHEKDYLPVAGLPTLRDAVAHHTCALVPNLTARSDDVMIAPGSKELIFLAQLVFEGRVLIPNPSWVSYVPQAQILGRAYEYVPTVEAERWMLTAERLEGVAAASSEPLLLILNYPSNPTGSSFAVDELRAIAAVCRKHQIVVISDEIYGLVDHAAQHHSLAEFYPEGTIVSGGLSKWCGAGGWRLGTFVFPSSLSWMREAMCVVASETYTSVSAPIQHAAVAGFSRSEELDAYLLASRAILGAVAGHCASALRDVEVTLPDPIGGFYLFPNFEAHRASLTARGIDDAKSLCARVLKDTGVACLPGSAFGRPSGELTARLAYVDFDGERALQAYAQGEEEQPADFVQSVAPRVVTACARIAAWLRGEGESTL